MIQVSSSTTRTLRSARARSACRYEPAPDKVRGLQEAYPRERARRRPPQTRGRRPPLLPHPMHRGSAGAGDGDSRRVAYDRPPRRGDGQLMARTPTRPPTDRGMWRRLLARVHPDAGGDDELFVWAKSLEELVRAKAQDVPAPPLGGTLQR